MNTDWRDEVVQVHLPEPPPEAFSNSQREYEGEDYISNRYLKPDTPRNLCTKPITLGVSETNTPTNMPNDHNTAIIENSTGIDSHTPRTARKTLIQVHKEKQRTKKQACKIFCIGLMATIYVYYIYIYIYRSYTPLSIYFS